jgi:hypothetical protein
MVVVVVVVKIGEVVKMVAFVMSVKAGADWGYSNMSAEDDAAFVQRMVFVVVEDAWNDVTVDA